MAKAREPTPPPGRDGQSTWRQVADGAASLDPPRPDVDRVTFGRLIEHGPAKHMHRPAAELSYFVKIATQRGAHVFWSPALKTAIAQSRTQPQVGDEIGVRENSILPVSVIHRVRNARGNVIAERSYDSPRTHWAIEKREWFDERMLAADALRNERLHPREAVRTYPHLLPAYLALDSARRVAQERVSPQNRERFVSLVRETLAHAVERGMQLPQLELRTASARQLQTAAQSPTAETREPSSSAAKAPARERDRSAPTR